MRIAYIRVSTIEQNEGRQLESMAPYNIEKKFVEKASAKDTNRPKFKEMLEFCREGDTIYVSDFSRLSRDTKDLLETVEKLSKKGVTLVSLKENINTNTANGKLMLTMIGAIAEFERANLLERQKEGIELAKKEGKYKGRKVIQRENFEKEYNRYLNREINKKELAAALEVSRPTLDKMIKEYKENSK